MTLGHNGGITDFLIPSPRGEPDGEVVTTQNGQYVLLNASGLGVITGSTDATLTQTGTTLGINLANENLWSAPIDAGTLHSAQNYFTVGPTTATGNSSNCYGFTFRVTVPITVSQLGRYYVAGNTLNHGINLWNTNVPGTPLATGTILAASASDSFGVKYVAVTPVVLQPGIKYSIGANETSGGDAFVNQGQYSATPGTTVSNIFTAIKGAFSLSGLPNTIPSDQFGVNGFPYNGCTMIFSYVDTTVSSSGLTTTGVLSGKQLYLPSTTAAGDGVIYQAGTYFIHGYGTGNTFVGQNAGNFTNTSLNNTGVGQNVFTAVTTGNFNMAFGNGGLGSLTTGQGNITIGNAAGGNISTQSDNTIIGNAAGYQTQPSASTLVGSQTGRYDPATVTHTGNTFIGAFINFAKAYSLTNAMALGASFTIFESNTALLGGPTGASSAFTLGGIGVSKPLGKWHVDGSTYVTDSTSVGTEKVTNGTFTGNDTGWTVGTGWAYGTNNEVKGTDGTGLLQQSVSAVVGEYYLISFVISGWSVGSVTATVGGGSTPAVIDNGTYTFILKATTTANLIFTPTNTSRFTLDTISVKKITSGNFFAMGSVHIGESVSTAKLSVLSTTEQSRLEYDASNYFSTTVGSTGGVTFDAAGAGAGFTFSDDITISTLTASDLLATDSNKKLISLTYNPPVDNTVGTTITWSAATAPTGTLTSSNLCETVGKVAFLQMRLSYVTPGIGVTGVDIDLPSTATCPAPLDVNGVADLNMITTGNAIFSTNLTSNTSTCRCILVKDNSAANGYKIRVFGTSGLFSGVVIQLNYMTA